MVVDVALVFVERVVVGTGKELDRVIDGVTLDGAHACVFQHFAQEQVGKFLREKAVVVDIVDEPGECKKDVAYFRDERVHDGRAAPEVGHVARHDFIHQGSRNAVALDFDAQLVHDFVEFQVLQALFP